MPTIVKKVVQLKNTSDELLDPIPALAKPGSVGGVLATAKTTEMTQPVGIDENGKRNRGKRPVDYSKIDWNDNVFNRDILVLEASDSAINNIGFGFLDAALEALKR